MIELKAVLERRGMTVVGPVEPGFGMDGGVIVKHSLIHKLVKDMPDHLWNKTPSGRDNTVIWPKGSVEGKRKCSYCFRSVGMQTDRFGTYIRPYKIVTPEDGDPFYLCFDTERCHGTSKELEDFGKAEAKAYFPEDEDEDEDDLNDVGEVVE